MNTERYLRLSAGSFVFIAAILSWLVSPWFLALIAFVGISLIQSSFTNWCPMMWGLRKAGAGNEWKGYAPSEPVA